MTKILIDEATVKLAMDALGQLWLFGDEAAVIANPALKALREALASGAMEQPAQQEPFGYFKAEPFGWTDCAETDEGAVALYTTPQPAPAQQEPVAWGYPDIGGIIDVICPEEHAREEGGYTVPLYTTPQPAQRTWVGLTEDEVFAVSNTMPYGDRFNFAEAIEAKLRSKNT